MPNNKDLALRRLLALVPRFQKNTAFKSEYCDNMGKFIREHAELCDPNSKDSHWFAPHHGVKAVGKSLRVVFNFAVEFRGYCLNDELLKGPDLMNLLVGVLIRYRKEVVAYSADLEACFHQIQIPREQRRYFCFLWWRDGDLSKPIQEYQMCVHPFGAASSPSVANYIVKQMGVDSQGRYGNDVRKLLERDFYVDNLLTSSPTEDVAVSLLSRTNSACEEGGFNLRKVASNSRVVMDSVPKNKRSASFENYDIGKMLPVEKALGVTWNIELDELGFRIVIRDNPLTRINILSTITSIYDPLGLVAPFLLPGRKLLQKLTIDKLPWEDVVPSDFRKGWMRWRCDLLQLKDLKVKRCYKPHNFGDIQDISLHHFSDANSYGYGCATYLRQVDDAGQVATSLVFGKSRVTPVKPCTIPRLELNACALSAEVGFMVRKELDMEDLQISQFFWTDSKICLGYICNDSKRYRVYVANRQEKVRQFSDPSQWIYVDSGNNPADHASRGLSVHDIYQTEQWFFAPEFLRQSEEPWKDSRPCSFTVPSDDPELKKAVSVVVTKICGELFSVLSHLESRFSKWKFFIKVMGWVCKYISLIRAPQQEVLPTLSVLDIQTAETCLLRMIQRRAFKDELAFYSRTNGTLPKNLRKGKGHIWRLDPFVDEQGLLRVGGRVKKSTFDYSDKHPIILPKDSVAVQRILEYHHMLVQHGGRPATINSIRSHGFWVVAVNARVKTLIFSCVKCRRLRGRLGEQKMADLPAERISSVAPFTHSGMDVFGHFKIKEGRRNCTRFVVLFTCFASRAVHLESITDLSSDAFILCLRRFLARRGPVSSLRSDNGTNFVGAANEFRKLYNEMDHTKISDFLLENRCDWIRWERNVPEASHAGGVWERQIRSVRSVLSSILLEHSSLLTDEVFRTFLAEAELIVNSRPITSDPTDPNAPPLSPIQLLTLKSKVVLPPPGEFQKEDVYCRRRWRHVQHLANVFWTRFRKEYLQSLQSRNKWSAVRRNFSVNDIVLLKDSNVPRQQWPMGIVTQVFSSDDGLVRSVELKVPSATAPLRRPIQKLVLLVEAEQALDSH